MHYLNFLYKLKDVYNNEKTKRKKMPGTKQRSNKTTEKENAIQMSIIVIAT